MTDIVEEYHTIAQEETDIERQLRENYQKCTEHRVSIIDGDKHRMPRSVSSEFQNESQHTYSRPCTPANQSIDSSKSQHISKVEDNMGSVDDLQGPEVCRVSTPELKSKDVRVSIGCESENEPSPVTAQVSPRDLGLAALLTLSPKSLMQLDHPENADKCSINCNGEIKRPDTYGSSNRISYLESDNTNAVRNTGMAGPALENRQVENTQIQLLGTYGPPISGMTIAPQMFFPNSVQTIPPQLINTPEVMQGVYEGPGYGHGIGVNVPVDAGMMQQNQMDQFAALQQMEQGGVMMSLPTPVPQPSPFVENITIPQTMEYRVPGVGYVTSNGPLVHHPVQQNLVPPHPGQVPVSGLPYLNTFPLSFPFLQPTPVNPYPLLPPVLPLENFPGLGNVPAGYTNVTAEFQNLLSIGAKESGLHTISEEVELKDTKQGSSANGVKATEGSSTVDDVSEAQKPVTDPEEGTEKAEPKSAFGSSDKNLDTKQTNNGENQPDGNNDAKKSDAKTTLENDVPDWFKNPHSRNSPKIPTKFRVQNEDIPDCDRDTKLNIVSFTMSTEKVLCDRVCEFVLSPEFCHKGVIWSCLVYPLGLDMIGAYVDVKIQIKSYKIDPRRSLKFKVILMHPEGDGDSYCQKQTGTYRLLDRNQMQDNCLSQDDDCLVLRKFHSREYLKLMFKQRETMRLKIELCDSREFENKDKLSKFFHWVHSELAHDCAKDVFQQHANEVLGLTMPLGNVSQKAIDDYREVQKEMQSWSSADEKFRKLPYEYYRLAQHYTTHFRLHELSTSSFQVSLFVEKIIRQILEDSEKRMSVDRKYYEQNLRMGESRA